MKADRITQQREFAACTIVAKNYLPMARVLADSWRQFHPSSPFFVLCLDSPNGFFAPEAEQFLTVDPAELDIPNLPGFLFKYSVLEASTAVKPYLLTHLFTKYGIHKLLYIDPDILILNSLSQLSEYLDTCNVLLTPHLLHPLPDDGYRQSEHGIMKSGTFNLGFLGLRNGTETDRLLRWWSEKLYHHCIVAPEQNLFVDQRWMDFAPSLFHGVRIVREPGYNIAYWNLHERIVSVDGGLAVNGEEPVYFVHFSGFDPDRPWMVSKHQNRFFMNGIGDLAQIYLRYRDLLLGAGWEHAKLWSYGLDFFTSGVRIPASARRYYWSLGPNTAHLGDPFQWLDSDAAQAKPAVDQREDRRYQLGGVNLIEMNRAETQGAVGIGSSSRIMAASGLPFSVTTSAILKAMSGAAPEDRPAENSCYLANLITCRADELPSLATKRPESLAGHFNIGYFCCETPEFPQAWATSFGYLDEVWTPSKFSRDAIASASPVPVKVVPYIPDPLAAASASVDRMKFGVRPEPYVFLLCFDFDSDLDRVNLFGLIETFKKAFGSRDDVLLLLQSVHGTAYPEALALLHGSVGGPNIRFFDADLNANQRHELLMAVDCYVSLHRSTGFGVSMAEAMLCGKPVIATGYSGNLDFMSDDDSYLIPYRKVGAVRGSGASESEFAWADPDTDYAVDAMRFVEGNRESSARIGLVARTKVSQLLDPNSVGRVVRSRLEELKIV